MMHLPKKKERKIESFAQSINCTSLKQNVSILSFSVVSMRKSIHLTSSVNECTRLFDVKLVDDAC